MTPMPDTKPRQTAPKSAFPFRWIPSRSLSERHRPRILAHLLGLPPHDRYLRFGYAASDGQVSAYVDRMDFDRDEVFGIFDRRLQLIGMAHLALLEPGAAEFGVSVSPWARGRGYGERLFDHAVLHARNRGVDTLVIYALSENSAMLKIARKAGARVVRSGGDAEARLALPPEDFASRVEELVESQAAELNYRVKVQARRAEAVIDAIGDVKQRMGARRRVASE